MFAQILRKRQEAWEKRFAAEKAERDDHVQAVERMTEKANRDRRRILWSLGPISFVVALGLIAIGKIAGNLLVSVLFE